MTLNHKLILPSKTQGFTIIELVVVIIILGIMSVTVIPKFFTASGFEEYGYRSEVIATLRTIQLRAMQQTQNNKCHTVQIVSTGKQLGLLKTLEPGGGCAVNVLHDDASAGDGPTHVQIDSNHAVTFSGDSFSFNHLGQPSACTAECQITITGAEQSLIVKVNSEGYIYAG